MVTEAIVLAGGLGSRLRGAVPELPKAMAPVAGQPFLEANGVVRVVLAVGCKSEAFREFFGRNSAKNCIFGRRGPFGNGRSAVKLTSLSDSF